MQCCVEEKIYDFLIIGAGPIGIEAATIASQNGLDTLLLEQGSFIGFYAKKFAHLGMFSPWYYNYSPNGVKTLQDAGLFIHPKSLYDTTESYLNNYLIPLAKTAKLAISYNTKVLKIGKLALAKTNLAGKNRKKQPFRLLCQRDGKKEFIYAYNVIDASGVYNTPLALGAGRVQAIGEEHNKSSILYQAIDKENAQRFEAKTTLILGQICCTAKSLNELQKYLDYNPKTKLIYVDETGLKPYISQLKNDIFTRRVESIRLANELLDSSSPQVRIIEKSGVFKIEKKEQGFEVYLISQKDHTIESLFVDTIVSNCGFQPDNSLYSELQVHECYASASPMNLASAMLEDTLDYRLTPSALGYETLTNPEPNFYILGSKSYGRNQGFSLHIGIGQTIELFSHILNKEKQEFLRSPLAEHQEVSFVVNKEEKLSTSSPLAPAKIQADQEQMYKTITENLQELIFQTDLKQKITYLSPSWTTLTGFSTQEFIGLDWQSLLHKDSQAQGLCQCNAFMSKQLETYREEFKILCKDGSIKWVEVNASVLVDSNNVAYGTIGSMLDITQRVAVLKELQEKNKQLDRLSITDDLTGLYNRRHFNEVFEHEYERALRGGNDFALIMCDIDFFKPYNDTYGHQKGDDTLKAVALVLQKSFTRRVDIVARYGGEEFVIILPATSQENAQKLVEDARKKIQALHIEHSNSDVSPYVTMSFGMICGRATPSKNPDQLLTLADNALYESKKMGRNRLSVYYLE
jgi:diguanylate cyclase (GGDEF)-like protein/PAS domain S-box-containing protein